MQQKKKKLGKTEIKMAARSSDKNKGSVSLGGVQSFDYMPSGI